MILFKQTYTIVIAGRVCVGGSLFSCVLMNYESDTLPKRLSSIKLCVGPREDMLNVVVFSIARPRPIRRHRK